MSNKRWALTVLVLFVFGGAAKVPSAKADEVEYQAAQISSDQWQYMYTLVGTPLSANQGLTVFFDPTLTSDLVDTSLDATDPTSAAAQDWASFTIQPDSVLNTDGYYTALALVDEDNSTEEVLTVIFDYSGVGAPGPQLFSIDQFDALGNLTSNLQTGETVPFAVATPEPATGLLLTLGLVCVVAAAIRRRCISAEV